MSFTLQMNGQAGTAYVIRDLTYTSLKRKLFLMRRLMGFLRLGLSDRGRITSSYGSGPNEASSLIDGPTARRGKYLDLETVILRLFVIAYSFTSPLWWVSFITWTLLNVGEMILNCQTSKVYVASLLLHNHSHTPLVRYSHAVRHTQQR